MPRATPPKTRPATARRSASTARPAPVKSAASKPPVRAKAASSKRAASAPDGTKATLTLSSKNYSSWSLRGWLLVRFAGLEFTEIMVSPDDEDARRELLLLAPSIRVPCLTHEGARVWNTLAIAHYLDEIRPTAGLLPADRIARAHCRSVCGEMNSGFANLRASLPMNLKGHFPGHRIWGGALPDIERVVEIWTECLATYGGPYLFGARRGMADAMFAPVVTRFLTYDVKVSPACAAYCQTIMAMPEMKQWVAAAQLEPADIEELDMHF